MISIHAPRTGSDGRSEAVPAYQKNFNPRSPHGERQARDGRADHGRRFQSTLPARGATLWPHQNRCGRRISIHAPRTGSDVHAQALHDVRHRISIHAPRTGSDREAMDYVEYLTAFQSTLPARGATLGGVAETLMEEISIHAPRTGSDRRGQPGRYTTRNFNPRSPHGERRPCAAHQAASQHISIHAPRTGSDGVDCRNAALDEISIHAPRTGSDWTVCPR